MKNRKYFLALTLSLLSFVLMFSCTKRSDKDEDEKPQTQENVNSNTEIANSENPNSETPQSENPAAEDSNGTAAGDDSKGGSSTSPKIDETVANSDEAKEFALDNVHNSTATFTNLQGKEGTCMLSGFSDSYLVAAINTEDYKDGLMAGAYLEVKTSKGTVNVLITSTVQPDSKKGGALCLDEQAFLKIADKGKGIADISWKVVALPTDKPVQFKYQTGSSKSWCGIQVRNHRYPLKKLEVKLHGKYVELPREPYNYFTAKEPGLGTGPYDFRLTDIFGHVIEEKSIPLKTDGGTVSGKNNFPY
jgi:expansin (peptidoglycan-binding protein)